MIAALDQLSPGVGVSALAALQSPQPPPMAVQHALAAEDWEHAADLIEQSGYVGIVRGQIRTVLSWLKGLPDALVRTRPWLCILHAFTLLFTNDQAAAAARLQAAEQRIQATPAPNQDQSMLGHLFTLRGAIAHFSGDLPGCVAYAQQALELLPQTETLSRPLAAVTTTSRQTMLNVHFSLLTFSPIYQFEFEDLTLVRVMIAQGQNDPDSPHIRLSNSAARPCRSNVVEMV
jgi:ATP/maltotriose-dependent transcriptional regulator MalT